MFRTFPDTQSIDVRIENGKPKGCKICKGFLLTRLGVLGNTSSEEPIQRLEAITRGA